MPSDPDLGLAMPDKGSYLQEYIDFGSTVTMAPPEFHLAGGLAQMAALYGNRVVFSLGARNYSPHLWLVLLGRAGQAKKSTAISLATDLLHEATKGRYRLPQEITREALWDLLKNRPAGLMELTEFMSFLERSKREYMSGIREDMCEMFDAPRSMIRRLRFGETEIQRPALTILGAAVVDSLADWARSRDLAGGFLSRFLFVPQTNPINYIGMRGVEHHGRPALLHGLRQLVERTDQFVGASTYKGATFSPDAEQAWEEYDRGWALSEHEVPVELSGIHGRLGLYTVKLALCYALAEGRPGHVTVRDVDHAIGFMEYVRGRMDRLVTKQKLGGTPTAQALAKAEQIIERLGARNGHSGWVPYREILQTSNVTTEELHRYIQTLEESGQIESRRIPSGTKGGRPGWEHRVRLVGQEEHKP